VDEKESHRSGLRTSSKYFLLAVLLLIGDGCCTTPKTPTPPQNMLLRCDGQNCLRVLTWNVHGLPFKANTPERLRQIAAKIAEQQPDLVLLQEVWLGRYKRLLRSALSPDYEMAYAPRCVTRWPRGGLVVFIRRGSPWRVDRSAFEPYVASAPWYRVSEMDGLSGKGILTVQIVSDNSALRVVDTHLQSPYLGRSYYTERRKQLDELWKSLKGRKVPTLIGGDFNTYPAEPLYRTHLSRLGTDLSRQEQQDCQCGTHFDDYGGRQEWIDYVLTQNWPVESQVTRIENDSIDNPYSDHDGVLARLVYDESALRTPEVSK